MKKNIFFLICFSLLLTATTLFAQDILSPINMRGSGDEVLGTFVFAGGGVRSQVYLSKTVMYDGSSQRTSNLGFISDGLEIVKGFYFNNEIFLVIKDAYGKTQLYKYSYSFSTFLGGSLTRPLKSEPYFLSESTGAMTNQFMGDAVYAITNTLCYITRDQFKTWQVDTTGLNKAIINLFGLDSTQYVYSATTKGLFKQDPNINTWVKIISFPLQSNLNRIFIDRSQRIYVSAVGNVYYSTDKGNTWTANNSGLNNSTIIGFGEDSYKNIYVRAGNQVFKSSGGTNSWVRIDKPVSDLFLDLSPTVIFPPKSRQREKPKC